LIEPSRRKRTGGAQRRRAACANSANDAPSLSVRWDVLRPHGGWQVQQPFPGIYLWRDPDGAMYLVDHTGTRRLRPDTTPEDQPASRQPLVIEMYRTMPILEIDHDAA
jgi:hypothetical protein